MAYSVAPDLLRWLPGPIVTPEQRALAVRRTALDLRHRAARRRLHHPETWVSVAQDLGIRVEAFYQPGGGRGRLLYDADLDCWMIHYNIAYSRLQQAQTLVHELAHYYFHQARGEWLCDEPVVYYYEGSVIEEHHKLARDVEPLVVEAWEQVPQVGLFDESIVM